MRNHLHYFISASIVVVLGLLILWSVKSDRYYVVYDIYTSDGDSHYVQHGPYHATEYSVSNMDAQSIAWEDASNRQ